MSQASGSDSESEPEFACRSQFRVAPTVEQNRFTESVKVVLGELRQKAEATGQRAHVLEPWLPGDDEEDDDECEEALGGLPTLVELRSRKVVFLDKRVDEELARVQRRLEVEGAPNGYQSTGTCASMYRVLQTELRRASGSFHTLMAVTMAFKEDDDCFGDTDMPEEAQRLVTRLGKLWQAAFTSGLPLDEQSLDGIKFLLRGFAEQLSEMPVPLTFPFEPPAGSTPKPKRRPCEEVAPSGEKPAKRPRTASLDADVSARLHRRDHELRLVQNAAVQIVCREVAGHKQARAVVVSGAYPLKALGKTLGAAFGLEGVLFDPHPNKGSGPTGLAFKLASASGEAAQLPLSLKVVQVFQERGDRIELTAGNRSIACTLDGVVSNTDKERKNLPHQYLPRCVGADAKSIAKVKKLNTLFLAGRKPGDFICCSKAEARQATIKEMGCPLIVHGEAQEHHSVLLGPGGVREPLVL